MGTAVARDKDLDYFEVTVNDSVLEQADEGSLLGAIMSKVDASQKVETSCDLGFC